ncbi:MAG: hypothetical protein HF973_18525 [Chloroflexi bacterium]|nr:hypothetical protein [Chloroflexota bacterium]
MESLRGIWLTGRRAGARRLLFRARRRAQLRLINPYLADSLYRVEANGRIPSSSETTPELQEQLAWLAHLRQRSHLDAAWDVTAETIMLLNQAPVPLRPPVVWAAQPIADPLWSFQLHGWEWAWPKLIDPEAHTAVLNLWQDWLAQVPFGQTLAWEPYPTSRRLVVWAAACHLLPVGKALVTAVARHAAYLTHHLERDLDNNHLIANAKALAWAGLLLPHLPQAAVWGEMGLAWLWRSLQAQVRSDGGHVENSASYHLAVWLDGLETALLCQTIGVPVPPEITNLLYRMGMYALALRRPDGRLPLLNDSIQDEPLPLAAILELAARVLDKPEFSAPDTLVQSQAFPDTGQVVFRLGQEETYLLFDAGDIGPDHCPGHGHADTLGFELWYRGQPLIVDPGTYQYAAGEWRDYFRSTAVHSTATVDGQNQTVFTGPFRVGDLAHGRLLSFDLAGEQPEAVGEHDGYGRLPDPVNHQRRIQSQSATKLTITDTFEGQAVHQIALHFHLASTQVELLAEDKALIRYPGGTELKLRVASDAPSQLSLADAWISRDWYQKERSVILTFQVEVQLPVTLITTIEIMSFRSHQ